MVKFSLLLFVFSAFTANAGVSAQHRVSNFSVKDATLLEVLKTIEAQSGLSCVYSNEDIAGVRNLSFEAAEAPVTRILDHCLSGTPLEYVIVDETIVIRSKTAQTQQPAKRERVISGTVKDVYGLPVIGATVVVKGTTRGTATDRDGAFRLAVPDGDNTVVSISFLGKKAQEIAITGDAPIAVVMEDEQTQIDEVVVTGMFNREASSFTGSVISLDKEAMLRVSNQNVFQSLKNLDPSLMIFDNFEFGSDPNQMPKMQLRGTSSFDFGGSSGGLDIKGTYGYDPNSPLFILDGFETTVERIMDLDMNRVESVTILKDASAKAIYGSKAANGVVVIETKKNTDGKLRVTYTGSIDIQAPDLSSYDLVNAAQKLEIEREAGIYLTDPTDVNADPLPLMRKYNRILTAVLAGVDTDWLSKPLRTGVGTKHAVSIELGGSDLRVIGDLSYNKTNGTMKGSDRATTAGSVMVTYRHKKFNFRNSLNITSVVANDSPYGQFSEYARMNPYWSPYDENGQLLQNIIFQFSDNPETETDFVANPLYNAQLGSLLRNEYIEMNNNSYVEWHILPGLKATARLGISEKRTKADEFYPANHLKFRSYSEEDMFRRGSYQINEGWSKGLQADVHINGSRYFGSDSRHVLFGDLGMELSSNSFEENVYLAEGFPNEVMNNIIFARQYAKDAKPEGSESTVHSVGFVAVASYSYDYRYLIDASFRTSASSQYGVNSRWGQFWSVGAGWNIHNEKWMKRFDKFREIKLRGSVGYTGAQSSDVYAALASYKYKMDSMYDNFLGAYLKGMKNDELKWEEKLDYNVGLDLRFTDALSLKFDYYIANTKNTLTDLSLPPSAGFNSVRENVGVVRNQGFDAYVTWTAWRKPEDQAYFSIVGAISHNKNKIIKISEALKTWNDRQDANFADRYSDEASKPVNKYYEGVSMTAIWAVPSLGIDPATGDELFMCSDGKIRNTWRAQDQVVCGDTNPDFSGTLGFNFSWRGWGVNMNFRYLWGGQMYNSTVVNLVENADLNYNVDRRVYDGRWRQPGDVTPYRKIQIRNYDPITYDYNPQIQRTQPTTRFVEDRNDFTLSSVNLSYDFYNRDMIRKIGLERLRLNFYMNDVFTWSSIHIERGTEYPFARSFSFSLQATF